MHENVITAASHRAFQDHQSIMPQGPRGFGSEHNCEDGRWLDAIAPWFVAVTGFEGLCVSQRADTSQGPKAN